MTKPTFSFSVCSNFSHVCAAQDFSQLILPPNPNHLDCAKDRPLKENYVNRRMVLHAEITSKGLFAVGSEEVRSRNSSKGTPLISAKTLKSSSQMKKMLENPRK